jgi:hypothetical protein
MLNLEQCRKVLGAGCKLSDSELEALRDQLYGLADIAIETFIEKRDRDRMNRGQKGQKTKTDSLVSEVEGTQP